MPRFDGTGPLGMGPMTGRGMGYCGGVNQMAANSASYPSMPYYWGRGLRRGFGRGLGRGFGRGFGWGRGRGRGFGRRFWW
jgi:hypothetical protein